MACGADITGGYLSLLPLFGKPDPVLTRWKAILDPVIAAFSATSGTQGYIGEVRGAFLTLSQFQQQSGTGWVLCNGQTVPGSSYAILTGALSVPDMRATVLRMKDNGRGLDPAGDLPLGSYEVDTTGVNGLALTDPGHTHTITDPTHNHTQNAHSHTVNTNQVTANTTTNGAGQFAPNASAATTNSVTPTNNASATGITINSATTGITVSSTDAETRAKSTIVNYFIRIN